MMARFSHKIAIAPTASISIICGGTQRLHRADPRQHLHAQDAVGRVHRCATRICEEFSRTRAPTSRRSGSRSSSMKARSQHLDMLDRARRRRSSAPRSRSTSAGSSNLPPTARRSSARASRSISICRPTSISGTCTCCTGRHGSTASRASTTAAPSRSAAPASPAAGQRREASQRPGSSAPITRSAWHVSRSTSTQRRSAHADRQRPHRPADFDRNLRCRSLCLGLRVLEAPAADPLDGRGSAARRRHQGLGVGPRDAEPSARC